jgi:hypothetical protein
MSQLYLAVHKNLAELQHESVEEHLLQVSSPHLLHPALISLQALSVDASRGQLWRQLGEVAMSKGEWAMAEFAFSHDLQYFESREKMIVVLFLAQNYASMWIAHSCIPSLSLFENVSLNCTRRSLCSRIPRGYSL